jgi:group I intron endonuclease
MKNVSGIYLIKCTPPGELPRYYVGQSMHLSVRWTRHKYQLKHGSHSNIRLQRAWNKYGKDAFSIEILEEHPPELLDEVEQWWLDEIVGSKRCFNLSMDAMAPARGRKVSDEEKRKILANRKAHVYTPEERVAISKRFSGENHPWYGKTLPLETRLKISEKAKGSGNPFYSKKHSDASRYKMSESRTGPKNARFGKPCSDEQKKKLSDANIGKKLSDETKAKISLRFSGERHPNYGKPLTAETRKKISASLSGRKYTGKITSGSDHPMSKKIRGTHIVTGEVLIFESMNSARSAGFTPSNISIVCNGKKPHHKGFHWAFFTG